MKNFLGVRQQRLSTLAGMTRASCATHFLLSRLVGPDFFLDGLAQELLVPGFHGIRFRDVFTPLPVGAPVAPSAKLSRWHCTAQGIAPVFRAAPIAVMIVAALTSGARTLGERGNRGLTLEKALPLKLAHGRTGIIRKCNGHCCER